MPIEIPLRKKYYTGEQIKDILDDFITDVRQEIKMLERFADLPTADVVERKHGEWELGRYDTFGKMKVMTFNCSVCGEETVSMISTDGILWDLEISHYFCPNCGADMRERGEDG